MFSQHPNWFITPSEDHKRLEEVFQRIPDTTPRLHVHRGQCTYSKCFRAICERVRKPSDNFEVRKLLALEKFTYAYLFPYRARNYVITFPNQSPFFKLSRVAIFASDNFSVNKLSHALAHNILKTHLLWLYIFLH